MKKKSTEDITRTMVDYARQRVREGDKRFADLGNLRSATIVRSGMAHGGWNADMLLAGPLSGKDPDLASQVAAFLNEYTGMSPKPPVTNDRFPPPSSPTPAPPPPPAAATAPEPNSGDWMFPDHLPPEVPANVRGLRAARVDGGVEYRWAPEGTGPTVYRLLSSDDFNHFPQPVRGVRTLGATEDTTFVDTTAPTTACRLVTVWAYPRPTDGGAIVDPPVLVAEEKYVVAVEIGDFDVSAGQVAMSWSPLEGATTVVYRWPTREFDRARSEGRVQDSSRRLPEVTPSGFHDRGVTAGERYVYAIVNHVEHAERGLLPVVLHSEVTLREVEIPTSLRPVTDLHLTQYEEHGHGLCDLTWRAVPGETVIYRTAHAPNADLVRLEQVTEEHLRSGGIEEAARVLIPVKQQDDDMRNLDAVPWLENQERMYFTPVTRGRNGTIAVGQTVVATRTLPITDVRLVQRTSWQRLTFVWPRGAAEVALYAMPFATDFDPASPSYRQIHHDEYRASGGFAVELDLSAGVTLYLVPFSFQDGRQVTGTPTRYDVESFHYYSYSLRTRRISLFKQGLEITVTYHGRATPAVPLNVALVANDDHVPLSPDVRNEPGSYYVPVHLPDAPESTAGEFFQLPPLQHNTATVVALSGPVNPRARFRLMPTVAFDQMDRVSFVREHQRPASARWR